MGVASSAWSQGQDGGVITPEQRQTKTRAAMIDTQKYELGMYVGNLSVEDFGNDVVSGVELSYRINRKWMVQANYGMASIDPASFEGQQSFLSDADRDFEYFAIVGAYQLINGRAFWGARQKFESEIFVLAGPEQVQFADNSSVGLVFGLSYRLVLTEWLTTNIDFREHLFDREFIGDSKQTFNTEFRLGFNFLF